jgi:hypothetical protein
MIFGIVASVTLVMMPIIFCSIFCCLLINKSLIVLFVMHVNLEALYGSLFLLPRLELLIFFVLIHCDLWTSPVLSIFGFKYFLVILDDFTHYLWTIPLWLKSDAYAALASFVRSLVHNLICLLHPDDTKQCSTSLRLQVKSVVARVNFPH